MADLDFKTGRLRGKYRVSRADGAPVGPEEAFFVLRTDTDHNARIAVMAYAAASRSVEKCLALRRNWRVEKSDGTTIDPEAEYFVLPLCADRHARSALRVYARFLSPENKGFAKEILEWLWEFVERDPIRCGCREAMCEHEPFFSKEGYEQLMAEQEVRRA